MLKETRRTDPELAQLCDEELYRQEHTIEMIASESSVPLPVMELSGSVFTNKTLEGYPGSRFQAGYGVADKMETLAVERAKKLFGAEAVNIQPYSGSTANYSVFATILKPGDKVLSMRLDQGGHLTHGSPANWVSGFYDFSFYPINPDTELIDYDALEKMANEIKPKLIIAGASSYSRLMDYERISKIAKSVDAYFMVDMAHISGLVAAKVIPSPVPYADFVTSSTTKTLCSARSGFVICKKELEKKLRRGTFPGALGSIHLHTMAAKAWTFKYAGTEEFRNIMLKVVENARKLSSELAARGFRVISGGTDNHLFVIDLTTKGITGKQYQEVMDSVGISINKNMIPFDKESPMVTSGARVGLTAVTERGMGAEEMVKIADMMTRVAENIDNQEVLDQVKKDVQELIVKFPLYPADYFKD